MSKNLLRAPLIKSAVLLFVFSLIIYLTVTSQEGSVLNSIGAIFYAVFKAAQLGVGLVLALVLCLVVLIGIFLGCVAMVSTESATRMYEQLSDILTDRLDFVKALFTREEEQKTDSAASLNELRSALQGEMAVQIESSLQDLRTRVEQVENDERLTMFGDRLQLQEVKMDVVEEKTGKGADDYQKMQENLQELAQQVQKLSSDTGMSDLVERITSLERKKSEIESLCTSLTQKIDLIQKEIDSLQKEETQDEHKSASPVTVDESEHRLFSYITNQKDKETITQLVADGITNELTYSQIVEHLTSKTGKASAKVITDHPSLTKDFIRSMKKVS